MNRSEQFIMVGMDAVKQTYAHCLVSVVCKSLTLNVKLIDSRTHFNSAFNICVFLVFSSDGPSSCRIVLEDN